MASRESVEAKNCAQQKKKSKVTPPVEGEQAEQEPVAPQSGLGAGSFSNADGRPEGSRGAAAASVDPRDEVAVAQSAAAEKERLSVIVVGRGPGEEAGVAIIEQLSVTGEKRVSVGSVGEGVARVE